jgi:glycosyltransferase involved in cell wall biosynthesis
VRKRRVLQLVLSLSPGGTERLVIDICKQLRDRIEPVVCCLDEPGSWAAELEALNIPVVSLGRQPGFQPRLATAVARVIRQHRIDVVHCHHYTPYVYGLMASLLTAVRVVFTEHGRLSDAAPSAKRRRINPLFSMLPGQICAVSADLKQHMVAEGFLSRRVHVVYNGIEPGTRPTPHECAAARQSLGLPPDAFVLGTVGRLDPVKNLRALLHMQPLLREQVRQARVVIIGDGPEKAALEDITQHLGLHDSVTLAGYRADVRALLPAFDVYMNCSTYEGVSLTILEAMAAALPVIASPVGGNPEVVIDHETGYLVPARPRAMADCAARLARDARLRRVVGDAGRWRVMRHFSLARMVAEYASFYLGERHQAVNEAPAVDPTAAERMSVTDATRSIV